MGRHSKRWRSQLEEGREIEILKNFGLIHALSLAINLAVGVVALSFIDPSEVFSISFTDNVGTLTSLAIGFLLI